MILLTGGTGAGQARFITAYVGATKVATVATWVTNPDNTTTFAILPFDSVAGASAPTVAQIATAVWEDLTAGGDFGTVGSIGKLLVTDIDAAISSRSSYAGGDTAGTTTLLSRLSATRAGYLDNLSAGAVALEASLQGLITTIGAAAAGVATAVWGSATRILTAGTNIVLAKGTGLMGLNDIAASAIISDATPFAGASVAAIKAKTDNLPGGIKKNTALSAFEFFMVDAIDHVTGKTGLTVTATRSIDGGAFASCANAPTEVSSGVYAIDLAAADLNGTVITLRFTGTGADATLLTVKTSL